MTARRRDGGASGKSRPRIPHGRRRRPEAVGVDLATPTGGASPMVAGPGAPRRKRKPRFVL